ncbi:HAD-IIB family hydrolase [Catenulispora pinisilvae]|uniref:HAD-IIB family hydrolase n=1 Tax=Catenulispora pinisilvae TaxID=2705253 RepID=UPI001891012C|nr:HAD-IIB family hydrolase [Catenulispora pinisilvae]
MTSHDPDARVLAFDLDGTLAESKSAITPRMAGLLVRLLDEVQVCIISGGAFPQFQAQVLDHLRAAPEQLARLNLMPTNGTRYYLYRDSAWREIYAEDLPEETKRKVIDVLTEGAKTLGLWEQDTWGDIVEDRGSQITFSALGQQAPVAAKTAWDPDGSKKERLRSWAAERLPGLEVRSGGTTSIDVTAQGIDKAYGMRKLMAELHVEMGDILFAGDRLEPQGNDHPVEAMGIRSVAVKRWQDTADFVERWLES